MGNEIVTARRSVSGYTQISDDRTPLSPSSVVRSVLWPANGRDVEVQKLDACGALVDQLKEARRDLKSAFSLFDVLEGASRRNASKEDVEPRDIKELREGLLAAVSRWAGFVESLSPEQLAQTELPELQKAAGALQSEAARLASKIKGKLEAKIPDAAKKPDTSDMPKPDKTKLDEPTIDSIHGFTGKLVKWAKGSRFKSFLLKTAAASVLWTLKMSMVVVPALGVLFSTGTVFSMFATGWLGGMSLPFGITAATLGVLGTFVGTLLISGVVPPVQYACNRIWAGLRESNGSV